MNILASLKTYVVVLVALSLVFLGAGAVQAGGMEAGDTGAEALGRGGAFAAKADDPSAINYNPAGFAKLTGHRVVVGFHAMHHSYSFERKGSFLSVDTERPWFSAPSHIMFSTDFGLRKGFTLGIGLYTPPSTPRQYPQSYGNSTAQVLPSPQRYDTVKVSGLVLFPSLVAAYQITPWLTVGASFQIWMLSTETRTVAAVSSACSQAEDPGCDVLVDMKVEDWFSPTGSLGILLRPHRQFELGVMVRFPASAEAKGKAKLTFGPEVDRLQSSMRYPLVEPDDPNVTMEMSYPWMLRAGARVIFFHGDEELADFEVDFVFENWSNASKRNVQIKARSLNEPMEPTVIDWKLKDTFSIRAGGSYQHALSAHVKVIYRAGLFVESATTDVSDTLLAIFSPMRFGVTGGLGLRWKWLSLDIALAHFVFPKRIVNNSTIRVTDFGGTAPGPVIGNGTYRASLTQISLQVGVSFGTEPQDSPSRKTPRIGDFQMGTSSTR
ncbi:MAG: hypothetical protein EP343_27130 [Deltaproteobacteria bacterium]|nr:MAG: hypothetical protein EP343_27130 [Deltaproteobacteria bacterium]